MYKYIILLISTLLSSTIQANPIYKIDCSYNNYCNNCVGSNIASWCKLCNGIYMCNQIPRYERKEIPRVEIPKFPKPNPPCLSCPPDNLRIKPDIQREWRR